MKDPALPQSISADLDFDRAHDIIKSEDIASTERALKQLASVTEDPQAAALLRQFASAIRPVSHWGLNE